MLFEMGGDSGEPGFVVIDGSEMVDGNRNSRRNISSKETPRWDVFKKRIKREQRRNDESLLIKVPLKIMRCLCYLVCFVITLASSVFAKMTLSMMSAQTAANRTMDLCVEAGTNKRYVVNTPPLERMSWTWSIWFVLVIPEFLVFITCLWVCVFKNCKKPGMKSFLVVLLSETLHVIGICLLVFVLAPTMDGISSLMFLNGLCLVPACLTLFNRSASDPMFHLNISFDVASIFAIAGGMVMWAQAERSWTLLIVGILISCVWWENFFDEDSSNPFFKYLSELRKDLKGDNSRYFVYVFISLWKIILSFVFFLILLVSTSEIKVVDLLPAFSDSFHNQPVALIQTWESATNNYQGIPGKELTSNGLLPVYFLLIQLGCALICYLTSIFSCQICIQEFSFSLPLTISVPIAAFLTSSLCSWRMEDFCFMKNIFPKYVFWKCPEGEFVSEFLGNQHGWIWLLWFLSQVWVTSHIWNPIHKRKVAVDSLFVTPLYNGAIIEQSLLLNRRKHRRNKPREMRDATMKRDTSNVSIMGYNDIYEVVDAIKPRSQIRIYACATMWHETPDEMLEMLKSVMRVDRHLSDQREARKYYKGDPTPDYEFEVHIHFDDAFQWETKKESVNGKDETKKFKAANDWVKKLVQLMSQAAAKIYPENIRELQQPSLTLTPYGGRLEWNLPGNTPLVVHLKDKDKIRHKKRWSQVMYMYYLLGYITMDPRNDHRRGEIEENTFILALDGDIDFKPGAVGRLLDLMEDKSLGAACGRIHPIGAGPIVWYQKFEYAIGHWLQKATEHVTGCVLCSPGCFSLFRAKAIMEVMRTYASVADQAIEYLQYDQGEDRWLCTLILKEGYRIEYSAASDAYTHAPESFPEFYIQRRRWGPSTMANIMDLLLDAKETVKRNNSISTPYIMYQCMIMLGTILGPGTIFLMVVGAMVSAFQISNFQALMYNVIPIMLFIIVCFYANNDVQIYFAMILSSAYALLMMAVLIATAIQLQQEGISSPSGIFLVGIASSFLISAIVHPQEFTCVCHGFLYFMLVPSMYLLLQIYSLINLYNVSWGTRENPAQKAEEEAMQKAVDEEKKGKLDDVSEWLGLKEKTSTLSKICQCFVCTRDNGEKEDEAVELLKKNTGYLENMDKRMKTIERTTDVMGRYASLAGYRRMPPGSSEALGTIKENSDPQLPEQKLPEEDTSANVPEVSVKPEIWKEDENDPVWAQDAIFEKSTRQRLTNVETTFWKEMIKKFLLPLDRSVKTEQRVKGELIDLRNKVVFAIFMMNGIFILVVFLLQLNKDELFIEWPIDAKFNITFLPDSKSIGIEYEYLKMDPIGLVFVVFFGTILIFQFFAMLAHRFGTFSHIMADTKLSCKNDTVEEFDGLSMHSEDEDENDTLTNSELPDAQRTPKLPRSNSNHAALTLNPADRRVSDFLLDKSETQKFTTLEEAARDKFRKDLRQLSRQNSTESKKFNLLRRASLNQSIRRIWRNEGVIGDDDLASVASRSQPNSPAISSRSKSIQPSRVTDVDDLV